MSKKVSMKDGHVCKFLLSTWGEKENVMAKMYSTHPIQMNTDEGTSKCPSHLQLSISAKLINKAQLAPTLRVLSMCYFFPSRLLLHRWSATILAADSTFWAQGRAL